jgi:hypothetical protein
MNGEDNSANASSRHELLKLWQLLAASLLAHAVVVVALSPSLFGAEKKTPEALLAKARGLAAEQKFDEALAAYQQMLLQKPQTPVIFAEAEKEMHGVRVKALEAQRRAAEEVEKADAAEEEAKPGPEEAGRPAGTSAVEAVELPVLPDIGGEL